MCSIDVQRYINSTKNRIIQSLGWDQCEKVRKIDQNPFDCTYARRWYDWVSYLCSMWIDLLANKTDAINRRQWWSIQSNNWLRDHISCIRTHTLIASCFWCTSVQCAQGYVHLFPLHESCTRSKQYITTLDGPRRRKRKNEHLRLTHLNGYM